MLTRIDFRRAGAAMLMTLALIGSAATAIAQEWNTAYGNSSTRTSRSSVIGPSHPAVAWQGSLSSFIAGAPVIGDGKVFVARMVNTSDIENGTTIVAHDLRTGEILWSTPLPVLPGEACVTSSAATTCDRSRVFAFHNNRVYASRGGVQGDPLYGLDPATGAVVFTSAEDVGMEDSFSPAFAPDGDLIVLTRCCIEADSLILLSPSLNDVVPISEGPGGGLGGNTYTFSATLTFDVQGTVNLASFHRTISMPVQVELWTTPASPGDAFQVIFAEIASIVGTFGDDPDFCTLNVSGGSALGQFSPGTITLTRIGGPGTDFTVDGLFDVRCQITYATCPESVIAGLAATESARFDWMQNCIVPDDGTGTADLPIDCTLTSPPEDAIDIRVFRGDLCMATAPTYGGASASAYCLTIPNSSDGRGPFIRRIDSATGETVWTSQRFGLLTQPASNMVIANGTVYVWESLPGSLGVTAIDLETGLDKYSFAIPSNDLTCVHPNWFGIPAQQTGLFAGPDGTIYAPRQERCLIAITDTGTGLEEKWRAQMGGEAFSTYAIGPDGSIYVTQSRAAGATQVNVIRLDPDDGSTMNVTTPSFLQGGSIRLACDAAGKVYVGNAENQLYCYRPDLTLLWSAVVGDMGFFGGPVIGGDGVVVVAGNATNLTAFRDPYGDLNCSDALTLADVEPFVLALVNPAGYAAAFPLCNHLSADMNFDGRIDGLDVRPFVTALPALAPGNLPIQYLTQDRYIFAEAEAPNDFDTTGTVSAGGFAPFNQTRTATADDGLNVVTSTVSQNSTLTAAAIDATGSVVGSITGPEGGTCFSDNAFIVTFTLPEPRNATLSGSVSANGPETSANFRFTGPGGDLVNTGNVTNNTVPYSFSGPLAAGQYTLRATTAYEFDSGNAQGSYSVDFDLVP